MDLSVNLAGLILEHPVMNGAGSCKDMEDVKLLARSAVAAIVVGSGTIEERSGNEGDVFSYDEVSSINSIGLRNPGRDRYQNELSDMVAIAHDAGKPLIFSAAGFSPEEYGILAELAAEAGADAVEVNLGCPNVWKGQAQKPIASFDLEIIAATHDRLRHHIGDSNLIVIEKFSPYSNPLQIEPTAREVNNSGIVKVVSLCNTFPNAFKFAPGTNRAAVVPNLGGFGGLAGPAMKAIALGQILQWKKFLDPAIQIIGAGGVGSGRDVQEFQWVGAVAVQMVTALLHKHQLDPGVFSRVLSELVELSEVA